MLLLGKLKSLKKNKTLVNGSVFSLFSFLNQGISFLLLIILAKYILPGDYGKLSLYNTIVMFIGYFIAMSTQGYISVVFFKDQKQVPSYFTSVMTISAMAFLLMLGICAVGCLCGGGLMGGFPFVYWLAALLCSLFMMLMNVNLDLFRCKESLKPYGLVSCGFAAVNFVFSLVLVIPLELGWNGRIVAQLVAAVFFAVCAIVFFLRQCLFVLSFDKSKIKELLFWGMPLIPHLATNWIRQGCDRYIISYNHTLSDVGIFSFALNISNIIVMIGHAFNQSNSVSVYKILGNSEMDVPTKLLRLKQERRNIIAIYVVALIVLSIACSLLVPVFLPKYADSVGFFLVLNVYGFFVCLYLAYCNYLFFFKKNKTIMKITFGSALAHLALSLILTRYSLYYTALIYCATQGFVFLIIRHKALQTLKTDLV